MSETKQERDARELAEVERSLRASGALDRFEAALRAAQAGKVGNEGQTAEDLGLPGKFGGRPVLRLTGLQCSERPTTPVAWNYGPRPTLAEVQEKTAQFAEYGAEWRQHLQTETTEAVPVQTVSVVRDAAEIEAD